MAAQKGRSLLLALGDGASPEVFTTVAGLTLTGMRINNQMVDVTTKDDSGIQTLLADAGVQEMVISGDGRFTDASSHDDIETAVNSRTENNWQLTLPNGDTYTQAMQVESYERAGPYDSEETFSISLRRSGSSTIARA